MRQEYNIGEIGQHPQINSIIEMSLGVAIGAVTFTGSIIAFGKLQGIISGKPVTFPGQHPLNALLGVSTDRADRRTCASPQSTLAFWAIVAVALRPGRPDDYPDRRRQLHR